MEDDVGPAAIPALQDLSKFQPLPDGLQQGFLNFIYLGRLLMHPDGFSSDPAFQFSGALGASTTTRALYYYGNSQGGIAGGALTAVEPDITRTVLYVPGMNYSTLLTRSVDFDDYALDPLPVLPERVRAAAAAGDDPDDVGPRRAERLRQPHDHRSAARHARAPRADRDGLWRPPGLERRHRGRGADDRRAAPLPDARLRRRRPASSTSSPTSRRSATSGAAANGNGMFVWDIGPKRDDGSGASRHRPGADHQHRARRLLRGRSARHGDRHLAARSAPRSPSFLEAERARSSIPAARTPATPRAGPARPSPRLPRVQREGRGDPLGRAR